MPPALARNRRRLTLDVATSTNEVALEAGRAGDPGPLWVTARRQSGGRGRRGRAWVSEEGNLYASLMLVDPASMADIANLPLVAALGVRNAVARLVPNGETRVAVKWPNDVLIDGAKAVGILLESDVSGPAPVVVIGCGINVAFVPADLPYRASGIVDAGGGADLETVFAALASSMDEALALFARGAGFAQVRAAWLSHAVGLGRPCRVNLAETSVDGRFEGLDERGRLILTMKDGARRTISAGDLFFPEPERGAGASAVLLPAGFET
ncbi:biotin--[acetyl-CoA-carboxylase] ligase [Aurantimonas sp. Leaf443]|uniref:biotin--[acetyl-CoA-carboxylase] ligase n=1 Tax=Aurantimonas sp. Leaf443 TaxID=1736378 RepID=UPI0006FA08BE|nr:biotin--[acetyl-CoA-carboxylase] ligase [Aurantimonas sp. Leaf443]KQT82742.1 biotin biosynthesis protein [Aurantimonas sp. Leaf443]